MLAKMFGQEKYIEEWVRRKSWVSSSDNLRAIQSWWDDPKVVNLLPVEEAQFISSTHKIPGETFKPIAQFCARKWLNEGGQRLWLAVCEVDKANAAIVTYIRTDPSHKYLGPRALLQLAVLDTSYIF
jgi:hypothetical protein